ncbi:DUF192 domain-containing protein [Patescibacteria group bacterium]|nr:DUF192 domain-containing protein [Patescibacteria group bacterium]
MRNYDKKLIFIFILLSMLGCGVVDEVTCQADLQEIELKSDDAVRYFCVEVANDDIIRNRGLSGREQPGENEGMLFIYKEEGFYSFWMKDMKFDLDILFFDKEGKLVDYLDNLKPCEGSECQGYMPKEPAMFVLEVREDVLENDEYELKMIK